MISSGPPRQIIFAETDGPAGVVVGAVVGVVFGVVLGVVCGVVAGGLPFDVTVAGGVVAPAPVATRLPAPCAVERVEPPAPPFAVVDPDPAPCRARVDGFALARVPAGAVVDDVPAPACTRAWWAPPLQPEITKTAASAAHFIRPTAQEYVTPVPDPLPAPGLCRKSGTRIA